MTQSEKDGQEDQPESPRRELVEEADAVPGGGGQEAESIPREAEDDSSSSLELQPDLKPTRRRVVRAIRQCLGCLTATAAMAAAYFTYQQWRELAVQSELNRQAIRQTERGLEATLAASSAAVRAAVAAEMQAVSATLQARQAAEQLNLAKRVADRTAENGRLERRPWVLIQAATLMPLVPGRPAVAQLLVTNTGPTPGLSVRIASALFGRTALPSLETDSLLTNQNSSLVLAPGQVVTVLDETSEVVLPRHVEALSLGQMRLYYTGTIYYRDIFNREHETDFCFATGPEGARRSTDVASDALMACNVGNELR